MTIDLESFTPWSALAGGALIGLAATLFVLGNGRIAGISGMLADALPFGDRPISGTSVAFLVGLAIAPLAMLLVAAPSTAVIDASLPELVLGGLFVGIGTRIGNGCTSGHGVCGLARFSPRSLVATITFVGAGMLTVLVMRHWLGGVS